MSANVRVPLSRDILWVLIGVQEVKDGERQNRERSKDGISTNKNPKCWCALKSNNSNVLELIVCNIFTRTPLITNTAPPFPVYVRRI